jgi:hypothetical protein
MYSVSALTGCVSMSARSYEGCARTPLTTQIYSMPLGERDDERFDVSTAITGTATAPRVWLEIMRRIYGIGALAVRRRDWWAVRTLTLQHSDRLTDYHPNWLRHTITMVSRAGHFRQQRDDGQTIDISLLSLAREDVARLDCLRADGIAENDAELGLDRRGQRPARRQPRTRLVDDRRHEDRPRRPAAADWRSE